MKFGQVFKDSLEKERFPPDWLDSAISYRQLKKCIHRLTDELSQVGLDPETLGKLLKHVESYNTSTRTDQEEDVQNRPFEYILACEDPERPDARGAEPSRAQRQPFHPKLLFYVDEQTRELHSAFLDQETKARLQMLAIATGMSDVRITEEEDPQDTYQGKSPGRSSSSLTTYRSRASSTNGRRQGYRMVEVPLTSDSEFFTKLSSELCGLEALQEREESKLHVQIGNLGKQIGKLADPGQRSNKKMIVTWRHIFQAYVESDIFFGTTESDHSTHDVAKAEKNFRDFTNAIVEQGLATKFKKQDSLKALSAFIQINQELLQALRFQEINRIAMTKILKKFDKRTALGVKTTFPRTIQFPTILSENLAKAICSQVHDEILSNVPRLDDYMCPMCFEIKWRPVRLRCGHTFCIRCLIVMQNNKQGKCPLCRERTVVDANSDNLDIELADFLKRWFPDEVKAKQKYNEMMAGVDQYGEVYRERCTIM